MSGYIRHRSGLLVPNPSGKGGFTNNGKGGLGGGHGGNPPGAVDPNAAAIYSSLVGWWPFNDTGASATFTDLHGSNPLTIIKASVASTAASNTENSSTLQTGGYSSHYGVIGDGGAQRFQHAYIPRSNTNLDLPNQSFTAFGWTCGSATTLGGARYIWSRVGATTSGRQWGIYLGSDGFIHGLVFDPTFAANADISLGIASQNSSMYLMAFGLDRANNIIRFRYKGPVSGSGGTARDLNLTASFPAALNTTAGNANFTFGEMFSNNNTYESGFQRNYEDSGRWSNCGFVQGLILSDAQFNYIYNNGVGISYATLKTQAGH